MDEEIEKFLKEFRDYQNYLKSLKDKIPESAYKFATASWHYNYNHSKCPHDAWLEEVKIYELSEGERHEIRTTEIFVKLLGAYHNGYIELIYKGVRSYSLKKPFINTIEFCNTDKTQDIAHDSHSDWLDDRIELSIDETILHKIEWNSGAEWLIECEDIEYKWIPFDMAAAITELSEQDYKAVRDGGTAVFNERRGLIEVSGSEAEMFLNGLITNDIKTLENKKWMLAAFPNVQGRLLAFVRVWKLDDKIYFDTEDATYETVLKNLERFTMAGDFKVRDLTEEYKYFSIQGEKSAELVAEVFDENLGNIENSDLRNYTFQNEKVMILRDANILKDGFHFFMPKTVSPHLAHKFREKEKHLIRVGEETFGILRIEAGLPLYGVDIDETNVVLESGLDEAVNFNKGCYIGQEIIARIHFRGHVAKKITGLIFEDENTNVNSGDEIKSPEGKNAGKITSVIFSPKLGKTIALAYVRYDFLAEGTELKVGDFAATVKNLPFIQSQNREP